MSWSYSRALVEEFSDQCLSDTGLSALLSTTPTPDQSYWPDKTTEHSRLSRFGMTYGLLTGIRGEELLTWFLEASRARTSALPEAGPDWTAKGQGYGEKWLGLLGKYDPVSCSLKTAQLSLLGDSTEFSPTLPRWGLMLDGELYPQPMLELRTGESEFGFWQTPVADDSVDRKKGKWNSRGEPKLSAQVMLYPTPCATDAGSGRFNTSVGSDKPRPTLAMMAKRNLWPTPTVCVNYNKPGASATSGMGLASAVKMWPTPCASASKGSSQASLVRKDGKDRSSDRLDHAVMASDSGQLNPEWVEWLMGWPIGHTALSALEMGRFQEFEQQHGSCFMETKEAA